MYEFALFLSVVFYVSLSFFSSNKRSIYCSIILVQARFPYEYTRTVQKVNGMSFKEVLLAIYPSFEVHLDQFRSNLSRLSKASLTHQPSLFA